MNLPEPITEGVQRRKAPWWAAIITTVIMALGGASGAILNYMDSRDARRVATQEAQAEGAVNAVWSQKQSQLYEKEISELKAEDRVSAARLDGLAKRLELLERRGGRSAVRASRNLGIEIPDRESAAKEAIKDLVSKRPPKPSRDDPAVKQMILQEALK